jgi:phenylpropionate dioxygenase-like ring-hydroxylating dioxygenase large terminal subunit
MPNEPAESDFRTKVTARPYPAAEYTGLVWIYMGPAERENRAQLSLARRLERDIERELHSNLRRRSGCGQCADEGVTRSVTRGPKSVTWAPKGVT